MPKMNVSFYDEPGHMTKIVRTECAIGMRELQLGETEVLKNAIERASREIEFHIQQEIMKVNVEDLVKQTIKEEVRKALVNRIDDLIEDMLD